MALPTGLSGAYSALGYGGDVHERLTTLAWLRVLTDPSCPTIGGHDPRTILRPPLGWDELLAFDPLPVHLDVLCGRLNDVIGESLLATGWSDVAAETVTRAARELGRWRMPAGDPLGVLYQLIDSQSGKSARGAFYTPYEVSLMMAKMTLPQPGQSVMDPCCGSGGMLLAALEACRDEYGADAMLELHGVDIDARAVRLAKLNLLLAGVGSARQTAAVGGDVEVVRARPQGWTIQCAA